jgi:recombination protein RecR
MAGRPVNTLNLRRFYAMLEMNLTFMEAFNNLVKTLSHLPGVGSKSARRIAYFLLRSDAPFAERLSRQLRELKSLITACPVCGFYSEGEHCVICDDPGRERATLCIVEQAQDAATIEESGEYKGLYHILNGALAPLDGVGPDELNIAGLLKRLKTEHFTEVILAMNLNLEGDATALYLQNLLEGENLTLTRIAGGLPAGSDLEYADKLTLSRSLRGRRPV